MTGGEKKNLEGRLLRQETSLFRRAVSLREKKQQQEEWKATRVPTAQGQAAGVEAPLDQPFAFALTFRRRRETLLSLSRQVYGYITNISASLPPPQTKLNSQNTMAGPPMYSLLKGRVLYDASPGSEFFMLSISNNVSSLKILKYFYGEYVQISFLMGVGREQAYLNTGRNCILAQMDHVP